jgi:8-oxo-dGTP pyrophosphatase MutT (NUDIX family)
MIVRPTARLIALDPDSAVLLFRCRFDDDPNLPRTFWVLPGGGVEPGESYENAARRELCEETGIAIDAVGPCVLEEEQPGRHPAFGDRDIVYRDRVFLTRLTASDVASLRPDAVKESGYQEHRWWTLDELDRTDETIRPEALPTIVRRVLAGS